MTSWLHTYVYDGPVLEFNRVICSNWKSNTKAPTEAKAKSNFAYQFKQSHNKEQRCKITLPGKIKLIG